MRRENWRTELIARGFHSQHGSLAQRGADYFGMPGPAEFIAATALFVLLIALSILNVLHRSFDSDESQHLHVIWGWARRFVQYRDNFDNHMPLFHIMFAPVASLIGERPTILYWMRFILLPMYFVAVWRTYQIGTRLFSPRCESVRDTGWHSLHRCAISCCRAAHV